MREIVFRVGEYTTLYDLHQMVWKFVRDHISDGIRFLFREAGGYVKVRYQYDAPVGREAPLPVKGRSYRFDIIIHPVKKSSALGRRVPMPKMADALAKVVELLEKSGFAVERIEGGYLSSVPLGKPGTRPVRMLRFLATGIVRVEDADKAAHALANGLGASKRFGYGMLDLYPTEES